MSDLPGQTTGGATGAPPGGDPGYPQQPQQPVAYSGDGPSGPRSGFWRRFAAVTHWLVPELRPTVRVSMAAIRSVWRFSLTMAAIAALSMLLTQMDRIFVSKLLSLQAFGYYSLAYTAGIAISLLQLSINSATLPAYAEAASHGTGELAERYAKVSELMSFAAALPCFLLVFFGGDILKVWVSADAARGAGVPLMLLAAGFFVNAAVSNAYLAAVATRNAGIPAMVNAVGALLYAPALFALTRSFGTVQTG